jgi:hypothetical protein
MALSALARYMRKNRMLKYGTGISGRRSSIRQPVAKGLTRGSMGSLGAAGLKSRNPDFGENQERTEMGLPKTPSSQFRRG